MADSTLTVLSLFSGIGGLDLGIRIARPDARAVVYVERDAYAASLLLARMEDEALEPAPVWCGNLEDFDGRPWRGAVDLVAASPPCQPYSVAGAQRGNEDHRSHGDGDGPIPAMLRIIGEVQPRYCFFENVGEWVTGGHFRSVRERLLDMGYQCQEPLFLGAKDVGAPHRRNRVWIVAHTRHLERERCPTEKGSTRVPRGEPAPQSAAMADSLRSKREPRPGRERVFDDGAKLADAPQRGQRIDGGASGSSGYAEQRDEAMGNPASDGNTNRQERTRRNWSDQFRRSMGNPDEQGPQGRHEPIAERRYELPAWPPGPSDDAGWREIIARHPEFAPAVEHTEKQRRPKRTTERRETENRSRREGIRTEPVGSSGSGNEAAVESGVRDLADGDADWVACRNDQLRALGNAVVPLVAATAFDVLLSEVEE